MSHAEEDKSYKRKVKDIFFFLLIKNNIYISGEIDFV